MPPQKWTTLRSLSLFLAKIPQHKNSRWGSRAGHRQTSQMVHPRGYEAQKTESNPTSNSFPQNSFCKAREPSWQGRGLVTREHRPGERGSSLPPISGAPSNKPQCLITSSPGATQMTKCQCVHCSTHQDSTLLLSGFGLWPKNAKCSLWDYLHEQSPANES